MAKICARQAGAGVALAGARICYLPPIVGSWLLEADLLDAEKETRWDMWTTYPYT